MRLLVFGLGYAGRALARRMAGRCEAIAGTVRDAGRAAALAGDGLSVLPFPAPDLAPLEAEIGRAEAALVTAPPGPEGDDVLSRLGEALAGAPRLRWIGYLSTVGVYGDQGGAWVDEATPPAPASARSRQRLAAERGWLALGERSGKAVAIFRLPGIYGPGRSAFDRLADGTARRWVKPGQVFNRAHVDDIAVVLEASLDQPRPGAVYNVADDEPAPPQDVIAEAARIAGIEPPPEEPFDPAALSPMGRSFYEENKRVRNDLIRRELGIRLAYPTYREGLRAIWAEERGRADQAG